MNNFNTIPDVDNPKSDVQAALLKLRLTAEESVSALAEQLAPLLEDMKRIILELWERVKAFLYISKKYSKIIHLSKYGKTARIRKKNRARLIRLFLREKYKPG